MLRACLVCVVLSSGCDLVLGLDLPVPTATPDAATPPPDGAAPDAPPDAACAMALAPIPVASDTMLLDDPNSANPSIRYGIADTMNVGQGGTSRVVLRFQLSAAERALLTSPTSALVDLRLRLRIRTTGGACGIDGCTSGATTFAVHALRDDWNEGTGAAYVGASWQVRSQTTSSDGLPWQVPGASGSNDRDPLVLGTLSTPAGASGDLEVPLRIDATARDVLAQRISAEGSLSLLLAPTQGGTLFLLSREGLADATSLRLATCP